MSKLKKKSEVMLSGLALAGRPVEEVLEEYNSLSATIKSLEARKREISNELKDLAQTSGRKDNKGSYYVEMGDKAFGRVRRRSIKFNPEKAETILRERGLYQLAIKEVVDEDLVNVLYQNGQLSVEDVQNMSDVTDTYAFYYGDKPKPESEEMPTVEVS